jgi:cysteine desulfurase/selenocysteine lyase
VSGHFDAAALRAQFPVLAQSVRGKPLAYLDNGATTQKPQVVIDAMTRFYSHDNANIHRAVHTLGERATAGYEGARVTVQRFLNARSEREIVFTRGTTEGINLVANSFLRPRLQPGDEILVTGMEHHANLVPWHLACAATGAQMRHVPLKDDGALDLDTVSGLLTERTRLFAFTAVSNALGTVNPVAQLVAQAHARGIPVLVDAAQAVAHLPAAELDVQALDCDFLVFSGHKIYGPTGIGVLYGKRALLDAMPPWQGGGDMIREVFLDRSTFAEAPSRFEAGTPPIAEAIGLAAALDWFSALDRPAALAHEDALLVRATEALRALPGVRIIGTAPRKVSVLSFVLDYAHPHDAGTFFDFEGVAVRAGHHCAQPVMARFGVPATLRATFAPYNSDADVEALLRAIARVHKTFTE